MAQQHFDQSFGSAAPENYQRFFVPAIAGPLADDLVRVAALHVGERVLDVGCGTGVGARLAAERVRPDGAVAGLDINPDMLAVARSITPPDMGIEWYEASAESMPLPSGAFDVVLCQMSLHFVADRLQGLREMRRVLASGGRVVLNVPGPAGPLFEVLANALGRHIAPQAAGFVRAVFALNEEAELEGLLEGAGFRARLSGRLWRPRTMTRARPWSARWLPAGRTSVPAAECTIGSES